MHLQVKFDADNDVCGNCKFMRYCSKKCQKKHWKTHKLECESVRAAFRSHRKDRKSDHMVFYGFLNEVQYREWMCLIAEFKGGPLVSTYDPSDYFAASSSAGPQPPSSSSASSS